MQSWFYTTISLVLSAFYQAFGFLCSLFRVNVHLSEYTFLIMRPRNINHFFIILRINAYPFIFLTSSLLTFFVHGIDSNCSYNHISNISSLLFVCEEILTKYSNVFIFCLVSKGIFRSSNIHFAYYLYLLTCNPLLVNSGIFFSILVFMFCSVVMIPVVCCSLCLAYWSDVFSIAYMRILSDDLSFR